MQVRIMSVMMALAVVCVIFGGFIESSSADNPASDATYKMRIGVILPMSGALAEYGDAARKGFELAFSEHPEIQQKAEFLFEDSQYNNTLAVSIFNRMRESQRIDFIYLWGYGPVQAVAPIAERAKYPLLAVTAESEAAAGRPHVIRFNFHAHELGEALGRYIASCHYRKLGIVKVEQAFINGIYQGLISSLPSSARAEVVSVNGLTDQDFRSAILRLKSSDFDAVGVLLLPGQIAQFYRQARALHFDPVTFGTHYFESRTEIEQSGQSMEGAAFAAIDVGQNFQDRYRRRFGNDNRITFAANAYDFAMLVNNLFAELKSRPGADSILAAFRTATARETAAEAMRFTDEPERGAGFSFPVVIKNIRQGEFVKADGGCAKPGRD